MRVRVRVRVLFRLILVTIDFFPLSPLRLLIPPLTYPIGLGA